MLKLRHKAYVCKCDVCGWEWTQVNGSTPARCPPSGCRSVMWNWGAMYSMVTLPKEQVAPVNPADFPAPIAGVFFTTSDPL